MSEQHWYGASQILNFTQNNHDAIIQTLDRHLGYDENFYPIFFPKDVYEAALDTVNDAKIIFTSGIHADYDHYDANPEQAVRDVGGRFAGYLTDARIDSIGHPTVCATLVFDPDPDIEQLIQEGKLSVSPSLGLTRDEAGNIIKIKFQNLLVFPETPGGMAVPGDPGTKILNSRPREAEPLQNHDNFTQNIGQPMTEPTVIEKPVVDPALAAQIKEIKEMAVQFSEFKKNSEDLKAQLEAKETELKAEREAHAQFTERIEREKQETYDREVKSLINDPNMPDGLKAGENWEENLMNDFKASPVQFTRRVMGVYAKQNVFLEKGGKEQGQQFSQQKSASYWDSDEGKLIMAKLNLKREQMGA